MNLYSKINENSNFLEQLFYQIGNNGPFILFISTLFLLKKKYHFFEFYIIGFILNIFLNQFLKILIKQPRPSVDSKTFDLAMKHMKNCTNYTNLISYDKVLGMPSGHSQGVFFTTTFIFLVYFNKKLSFNKNNIYILLFYIVISLVTITQRVYYKFHTINQIIVGGLIGISFAYLVYYISVKKINGLFKEREDENGPL
jgi:membrane-associated phospholipid phosphatase